MLKSSYPKRCLFLNLAIMKNLLLLIILLLSTAPMFSQLFVRPNPSSSEDSFVYVKDQILFVEQGINLEINTNDPTNTEASIYLRDFGQLLQGESATPNSGTGLLSIQQNTPADDAWDYTFWASPVGNPALGGGSAGNKNFGISHLYEPTSVTAATKAVNTADYNGFSNPFTISRRWIYTHETPGTEAEADYSHRGGNDAIPPGYGFLMKGINIDGLPGNHDWNYDFRGRANNGTFTIPVDDGLMTLTGNPYPSALDLALVVFNNLNVGAIWFWDEDRTIDSHYYTDNRGGFGTWVPGGGTNGNYIPPTFVEWDASGGGGGGGTGGTGDDYNRRYSPVGQGFMLIGNNNAPGNATIDNKMRLYQKEGTNSDFRNNDDSSSGAVDENPDTYWPQFRVISEFGESHSRILSLMFWEGSTHGYDHGMDGYHPMDADNSEAFFPIFDNVGDVINEYGTYAIQTLPYRNEDKIPLAFSLEEQTTISVKARDYINFEHNAYLWDKYENTISQISGEENEAILDLPAGMYDSRFYIVFNSYRESIESSEGTLAQENVRANIDFYQNNRVRQLEITNPEGYSIKQANVFDMAGKLIISKSNIGSNQNITVSTAMLSDGVYIIRLTTVDYIDIDYKMIIENK
jgi:hypothetical protein